MNNCRIEIIFAGVNDIVPNPPTKERVWEHIQQMKRHAEAQGMVVGIHERVVSEYGPIATTKGVVMPEPTDTATGQPLVIGAFYMVVPVLDPETDEEWEQDWQPARYAGGGKWHCLNIGGQSDWPMRGIGARIYPTPTSEEH